MTTATPAGSDDTPADPRRYRRIAAALYNEIMTGRRPPRTALSTAAVLSGQHQCSPQTALKALHWLRAEGTAELIPGMGYYVAPPLSERRHRD